MTVTIDPFWYKLDEILDDNKLQQLIEEPNRGRTHWSSFLQMLYQKS